MSENSGNDTPCRIKIRTSGRNSFRKAESNAPLIRCPGSSDVSTLLRLSTTNPVSRVPAWEIYPKPRARQARCPSLQLSARQNKPASADYSGNLLFSLGLLLRHSLRPALGITLSYLNQTTEIWFAIRYFQIGFREPRIQHEAARSGATWMPHQHAKIC